MASTPLELPLYKPYQSQSLPSELPLQRRLNTPLELPWYEHKSNEQRRAPRGFTKPNSEEECKPVDWPRRYGIVDDIVQIVVKLQSEVNGSEI